MDLDRPGCSLASRSSSCCPTPHLPIRPAQLDSRIPSSARPSSRICIALLPRLPVCRDNNPPRRRHLSRLPPAPLAEQIGLPAVNGGPPALQDFLDRKGRRPV